MAIDAVAALACSLGHRTRLLQGRNGMAIPHYIRDLMRHSVWWPGNRRLAQAPGCLRAAIFGKGDD
jgi:hypothetical protein